MTEKIKQKGKVIELRDHQQAALDLQTMREQGESIVLLYHATGTGKTVTAVSDVKRLGKRTLFLAHTKELITQAKGTFEELWDQAETGLYVAEEKAEDAYVVCSSIQSVARNLELGVNGKILERGWLICIAVPTALGMLKSKRLFRVVMM